MSISHVYTTSLAQASASSIYLENKKQPSEKFQKAVSFFTLEWECKQVDTEYNRHPEIDD